MVHQAYSIGEPTSEYPNPLPVPQVVIVAYWLITFSQLSCFLFGSPKATVMADVASAIFEGGLPYTMITIGGVGALLVRQMNV